MAKSLTSDPYFLLWMEDAQKLLDKRGEVFFDQIVAAKQSRSTWRAMKRKLEEKRGKKLHVVNRLFQKQTDRSINKDGWSEDEFPEKFLPGQGKNRQAAGWIEVTPKHERVVKASDSRKRKTAKGIVNEIAASVSDGVVTGVYGANVIKTGLLAGRQQRPTLEVDKPLI